MKFAAALIALAVAFGGIPAALDNWDEFLSRRMGEDYAAEWYILVATVAPWTRYAAVVFAVLVMLSTRRSFRRIWRKLDRIRRRMMDEVRWIGRSAAISMIQDSEWVEVRSPYSNDQPHFMRRITSGAAFASSQETHSLRAFARYALKSFISHNSDAVQGAGKDMKVRQDKLEEWLDCQLEDFVLDRFGGNIPSIGV